MVILNKTLSALDIQPESSLDNFWVAGYDSTRPVDHRNTRLAFPVLLSHAGGLASEKLTVDANGNLNINTSSPPTTPNSTVPVFQAYHAQHAQSGAFVPLFGVHCGIGGTGSSGSNALTYFNVDGDNFDGTTGGLTYLSAAGVVNGASVKGNRVGISGSVSLTHRTANTGNGKYYVGGYFLAAASADDSASALAPAGSLLATNPVCRLLSGATNWKSQCISEFDIRTDPGTSVWYRTGLKVASYWGNGARGSQTDGAIKIAGSTNGGYTLASMSWSGGTVTAATTITAGLTVGATYTVKITDAVGSIVPDGYNGAFTATATGSGSFTFPQPVNPGTFSGTAKCGFTSAVGWLMGLSFGDGEGSWGIDPTAGVLIGAEATLLSTAPYAAAFGIKLDNVTFSDAFLQSSGFKVDGSGHLNVTPWGNYANNAAAVTAGVPVNGVYRNGDVLMVCHT